METISFSNWEKLDLRVGKILKVEEIENADKLYKLEVDIGEEKPRILVAGIKKFYKKDELKGKKCVLFVNLESRVMRGIKSEGMLLAAESEDKSKVILLVPEKDIEAGSKIR